jgi:MFS family permease
MRSAALAMAAAILLAGATDEQARLAAVLAVAGGLWAFVLVPAYPLVADQGGRDRVGTFTGLYYLAGSGAAILAPGVSGAAMDAFGNRALFATAALSLAMGFVLLAAARRRGVRAAAIATGTLDPSPAGEQADQEQHDGDDEQGVDEPAERRSRDQAE